MALATIMCPEEFSSTVYSLCDSRNGRIVN